MLSAGLTFSEELRIKLTRLIGEGGMASVYECLIYGPEDFEKIACIKLIKEAYCNDFDFVKRFVTEAKLVADLVHQNIVQVYKLGKAGSQYYILMEYVQGVDLSTFLQRHRALNKRVPVDIAAFIVSRVCRGLEYAHSKKDKEGNPLQVVHRDISPKNLMISREGEIRITDFGVAQIANEEDQYLVGKVAYMSPEQLKRRKVDSRSDLFSLGVVLYEILTMQKLFNKNTEEIIESIIREDIPDPSSINFNIPQALDRIVMKALEKDPAKRYQTAGEMGYDLEYFIYHKGYGPTIQTMATYLNQFFPSLYYIKFPTLDEKDNMTANDGEGDVSADAPDFARQQGGHADDDAQDRPAMGKQADAAGEAEFEGKKEGPAMVTKILNIHDAKSVKDPGTRRLSESQKLRNMINSA